MPYLTWQLGNANPILIFMAAQYVSLRNLKFLMHQVHTVARLTELEPYKAHSTETFDMMLEGAMKLADSFRPFALEMDREEPNLANGVVQVHEAVAGMMKEFGEGGWLLTTVPESEGGMQLPGVVSSAANFIFGAANKASAIYSGLLIGAARLILNYGTRELKDIYLPPMYAGRWQGTMCLTEPQAGSSLSDVKSTATPNTDGSYQIKGHKIFISAGDYHSAENIIHLVLARLPGAPVGTKGISLFVVPKYRPEADKLTPNDVYTAGVYHKMGERAVPACHIVFGDGNGCKGWLVGQENQGLQYMFQMMNEARIGVGVGACSLMSAAYYASLAYANERPQGRSLTNRDAGTSQVTIIEHADVKRMLLQQKAVLEGSLSLLFEAAILHDITHASEGPTQQQAHLLLELLTPVAKTYPSETANITIAAAMQVLGGYGYTRDFPIEMYYRDIKISTIYEGTTGIQGQDLLGRKVTMKGGEALKLYAAEVAKTISEASAHESLKPFAQTLQKELGRLSEVTQHLVAFAMQGQTDRYLADATIYLEFFGIGTIAWQWLKMGVASAKALQSKPTGDELNFYQSKLLALRYYYAYELPKTSALAKRLMDADTLTLEATPETIV